MHMAQLRHDYNQFTAADAEIVVVGPEDALAFSIYWKLNALPFVGLPDPKHHVLKLYGQQVKLFKFGRLPAQVTIDKLGIVRYVHYGHEATDIPANAELLAILHTINQENKHA